jgi:adenylosuccinate synthase
MAHVAKLFEPGKASFIIGGQFGSEGKGAAAAHLAATLAEHHGKSFDIITTNAGAQAGHTSVHHGRTMVSNFLPTAALIAYEHGITPITYLNAGAIINPEMLLNEIESLVPPAYHQLIKIHPNAAIITEDCIMAERDPTSAQTAIASTQKGVGQALARKVLRSGPIARDCAALRRFVSDPLPLNAMLAADLTALVEVPQGFGLSLDSRFYPHCTSRNSSIPGAMDAAGIHPRFCGKIMAVMRTFPIRVGNIEGGHSGNVYPDQTELTWEQVGRPVELTTVTKRPRRIFSFSEMQLLDVLVHIRPDIVMLTFCDYVDAERQREIVDTIRKWWGTPLNAESADIILAHGPSTNDVSDYIPEHVK